MGRGPESSVSWGVNSSGHEIAFIPGPENSGGMSSTDALSAAAALELEASSLKGGAPLAMRERAAKLLNLAINQEAISGLNNPLSI